jgi:hypothetical protein
VRIALASAAAATVVIAAACSAAPPATTAASSPAPVVAATSAPGVTLTPGPTTTRASARSASPTRATPTRTSQPPTPSAPSSPAPSATGTARLVTFRNNVDQTIWVAASPDATAPLAATGWVLPAGQSVTITVPNNWNGRFWGRTGCVFNSQGTGHCETGDCGGKFQCTGWGTIPATLAEYDMDAWDGMDFYDVSMVDGSTLYL